MKLLYFGKNLKYLRKSKDLTQNEISIILGINKTLIPKYELNDTNPSIDTLIKIADYFSVSIDALLLHDMAVVGIVNEPPAKYNTAQHDTELKSALQRVKDLEQTIAAKDELIAVLKIYNK